MIARTIFSEGHKQFREMVHRFVAKEIVPFYRDWEREGIVPRDVWRRAGELGILCPTVPEEYGGPGGDFLHGAVVIEEMAAAGAMAPTFYVQSEIVAPYLLHYGSEEQKRALLPGMLSGEIVTAVAMSEPGGGSDLAHLRTSARRDGDEWVISGQKVFITNGFLADVVVVACRTNEHTGGRGVSLVIVETDRPGFERGRRLEKLGWRASDTAELFFDEVRVPSTALLGEEGHGFRYLMQELAQERLIQAVRAVTTSESAIEWTLAYTTSRDMFGHTLADFQNTQFTMAQLHSEVLAARIFTDRCMELHAKGELDAVDAAKAKLISSQLQGRVMDECLQLFGGWGYMLEYPIARAWADARMTRLGGGAVEVMKHIIGRDLYAQHG